MPGVCDLTPKFRIASTHEKVRKKEVETLFWYIKSSFILLFNNYEYFCCFQGTSVMLLLDTGVRQKRKSVRWKYKILLFVQKSMCTEQMKLNKAGEIPCWSIYIWVVFFCRNSWAQKYDLFNQLPTLKENWSRKMNEIRVVWIQMKLKSLSCYDS